MSLSGGIGRGQRLLRELSARSFSRGSSRTVAASSAISAMKRLGCAGTTSRPFLRRLIQLTASVRCARVMPTYIKRRSSCRRCRMPSLIGPPVCPDAASSSPSLNGSRPSFTPTSITCGHSSPLDACSVDRVSMLGSCSRSSRVDSSEMVWATSSRLFFSLAMLTPAASSISPPQRAPIQSQNSITLVQRAAATFSFSSPS
jgi:hypothetical protein